MNRRLALILAMILLLVAPGHAASLDGKSYDVVFQADAPEKGTIAFENGAIVSSIHKHIVDGENEVQQLEGFKRIPVPSGAPFSDQELPEGINFTGRIEGFPPIYWSGWVRGSEIEGSVNVESFAGGYTIPFKGNEK